MNPEVQVRKVGVRLRRMVPVKYVVGAENCLSCLCNNTGFCRFYSRNIELSPECLVKDEKPAWCSIERIELFGVHEVVDNEETNGKTS